MGNQLESEASKISQKSKMDEVNDTEWETVNMKTPCDKKYGQARIPLKTQLDIAIECSSRKRWSNTRKITKLSLAARSINKTNREEINQLKAVSNNPNSTICVGGLPFVKSMIATKYSPIKKIGVSSQKENLMPLTKPVVDSKNSGFESSTSKVKRWLVNTEKHCGKRSNDHFHDKDQQKENLCDDREARSATNLKIRKTNVEQNEIKQLNEPSPIISEFNHYVHETTFESKILSEIEKDSAKELVKTQRKRKKKRITMKTTPRKLLKKNNVKKDLIDRVKGKELVVVAKRPLSVGSLAFCQPHAYNLRSKDRMNLCFMNLAEQVAENGNTDYNKKIEALKPNGFIINKEVCDKKVSWKDKRLNCRNDVSPNLMYDIHLSSSKVNENQLNLPETICEKDSTDDSLVETSPSCIKPDKICEKDCDDDNLGETPPLCIKSSMKSTNNSKRKLSFYDRVVIASAETTKGSEVRCLSTKCCSSIESANDLIQNVAIKKLDMNFQETLRNVCVDANDSESDVSSCCLYENEFSIGKHVLVKFNHEHLTKAMSYETNDNSEISTCFLECSENDLNNN